MMGVPSEVFRQGRDVYWRYDWEDVAFRWEHGSRKTFQKFQGEDEFEAHSDSTLDREAQLGGVEITKEAYEQF